MEEWAQSPLFYLYVALTMPALGHDELAQRISEIGEGVAAGTGIEIVEVELRGSGSARLLRIYIDKPGGVTHGDCELISARMGQLLDEQDLIPDNRYTLEVSSPGVERKLSKPRDFERVIGQKVRILLREPVEGQARLEGTLSGCANQTLEIETPSGEHVQVPLELVRKANLKFEW